MTRLPWCLIASLMVSTPGFAGSIDSSDQPAKSIHIYGGVGYFKIPNSTWSERLEDSDLEIAGDRNNGLQFGLMVKESGRRYFDISVSQYSTDDRTVAGGQITEADYSVTTIDLAGHISV